jgi:hypothetical protein
MAQHHPCLKKMSTPVTTRPRMSLARYAIKQNAMQFSSHVGTTSVVLLVLRDVNAAPFVELNLMTSLRFINSEVLYLKL